jgi:hypothetical protein
MNTGDGKILLSHIAICTAQGAIRTITTNKSLDSDEVITYEIEPEERDRLAKYAVISQLAPEEWNKKIYKYKQSTDRDVCIVYGILHEQDPFYLQYKAYYGEQFQTIGATAALHFFSLRKRGVSRQSLPVHGVLLQNPDSKCAE